MIEADYDNGATIKTYGYDLAGNMTNMNGTTRTYNAANQMTNDGTNTLTYDANGNLTNDGANSYTWDRANRLTQVGSTTYAYDGLGNRVQQNALKYILDLQPSLAKVIGDSDGNSFIHAPRGIHAMENSTGDWTYAAQDGLGSVRAEIDSFAAVQSSQDYDPYLTPMNVMGTAELPFGATGEQVDDNGLLYLRARYMNPSMGGFLSLDPFEGTHQRPMSLNGYSWVESNTPNTVDASGLCGGDFCNPSQIPNSELPCWNAKKDLYQKYGVLLRGEWNRTEIENVAYGFELVSNRLSEFTGSDGFGVFRGEYSPIILQVEEYATVCEHPMGCPPMLEIPTYPEGRVYGLVPRTIHIRRDMLQTRDGAGAVVIHELGHTTHYLRLFGLTTDGLREAADYECRYGIVDCHVGPNTEPPTSEYGLNNINEDFAETFYSFTVDSNGLQTQRPKRFGYFSQKFDEYTPNWEKAYSMFEWVEAYYVENCPTGIGSGCGLTNCHNITQPLHLEWLGRFGSMSIFSYLRTC